MSHGRLLADRARSRRELTTASATRVDNTSSATFIRRSVMHRRHLPRVFASLCLLVGGLTALAPQAHAATGFQMTWPATGAGGQGIGAIVGDCRPLGSCSRSHNGYDIGGGTSTNIPV